ncbi:hypothetical protein [Mycobacterium lepromatosis]|uniref:hypothetical protein n=1 Tax=Mycobacterium lepromatosis TaxID=480418 RepID=UPI003B508826
MSYSIKGGKRDSAAATHPQREKRGVQASYPVFDVRITLLDGKVHSVDSLDFTFQKVGAMALLKTAAATKVTLLEPIDEISVLVSDKVVDAVIGDLSILSRPGSQH